MEIAWDEMTPELRQAWLQMMFEHEYCDECGGDVEHHDCTADPFGLPHATCKLPAWRIEWRDSDNDCLDCVIPGRNKREARAEWLRRFTNPSLRIVAVYRVLQA